MTCTIISGIIFFRLSENSLAISLEEARRTTTVYAKMEHGVKRMLWLGS